MKIYNKLILVVLCVFLCVPLFFGCNSKNQKAEAIKNQHEYNLNVVLDDEKKSLNIEQKLLFNNFSKNSLNEVKLNIYGNAYRSDAKYKVSPVYLEETFPNGLSFGNVDITQVKVNKSEIKINVLGDDQNLLVVNLNEPLKQGDKVEIEVSYSINLANIRHRLGYADNVFTLANFYLSPCYLNEDGTFFENHYYDYGDPFCENLAKFDVNFTLKKGFNVFSSGELVNEIENLDNTKTLTLKSELTRSFAIIASNELKSVQKTVGNTKIVYAYLTDEKPQTTLSVAVDAFKTFSSTFGELNKKSIVVVESFYAFGGMEFSNLVLVTSKALNDHNNFENIVVHELAHEWWYDVVGNNQVLEPLLDEGLTEFSAMYYVFKKQGLTALREIAAKNLNSHILFLDLEKNLYDKVDESLNRGLNDFKTGGEYSQIIYVRGSLMFYNLFELLGEKKFDKALKLYFEKNQYKTASINNLVGAFNSVAKYNLKNYFENWLTGNINISQI